MFADAEFARALAVVLRAARHGGADADVARAVAARIPDGDADAWVLEWIAAGGEAWAAGDRPLHAAAYYGAALALVHRSSEPERADRLWRRQRCCWDRAAARFAVPAVRLAIPYEDTVLPGYFFAAPDARPGERRATIIINNGTYGATSQAWAEAGAQAAARGHHWMTFDGPGQQAALVEQGLPARPDWEAVLTPVLDALAQRPEVDPARIAVIGLGQGAYLVARALAFEHRPAAAVAAPGVVDVGAPWRAALPPGLRALLRRGEAAAFDRELRLAGLFDPAADARLRRYGAPYQPGGGSPAALFDRVAAFRLGDEDARRIRTPLLVADAGRATAWPGQSERLLAALPGDKALLRCEDRVTRDGRVFAWLRARLAVSVR
jgi:hypothetical protein